MSDIVLRVAAKAVIVNKRGEVLVLREAGTYLEGSQLGKYGIPGGRLNPGESYHAGLHREVKEETNLEVKALYPIYVGEWYPVIKGVPHHIIAIFTVCSTQTIDVKLSDEHDDFKWVKPGLSQKLNIMEPDDKVIERFGVWKEFTEKLL